MKQLFFVLLALFIANGALANTSSLHFTFGQQELTIQLPEGSNRLDPYQVELLWELGGQQALHNGTFCFKGDPSGAIAIIQALSNSGVFGDGFEVRGACTQALTPHQITYDIHDGPNDLQKMSTVTIEACPE